MRLSQLWVNVYSDIFPKITVAQRSQAHGIASITYNTLSTSLGDFVLTMVQDAKKNNKNKVALGIIDAWNLQSSTDKISHLK